MQETEEEEAENQENQTIGEWETEQIQFILNRFIYITPRLVLALVWVLFSYAETLQINMTGTVC